MAVLLDSRVPARFWNKVTVDAQTGCWLWNGQVMPNGYGRISIGSRTDGSRRNEGTHRFAFEALVRPIPDGLHIDHVCRVRRCCNPDHLEPVTCKENLMRGDTLARHNAEKDECVNGHPFTKENTRLLPKKRVCRECERVRRRAQNPEELAAYQRAYYLANRERVLERQRRQRKAIQW